MEIQNPFFVSAVLNSVLGSGCFIPMPRFEVRSGGAKIPRIELSQPLPNRVGRFSFTGLRSSGRGAGVAVQESRQSLDVSEWSVIHHQVPYPGLMVTPGNRQLPIIIEKLDVRQAAQQAQGRCERIAIFARPHSSRPVKAGGGGPLDVRAESDPFDLMSVLKRAHLATGVAGWPNVNPEILPRCGHPSAVPAEYAAQNTVTLKHLEATALSG